MIDCTTPIEAATAYGKRGWSVTPTRGKSPFITGWQKSRLQSEEEIQQTFSKDNNVGVLLGEPSGGLVDVDLDHELAVTLASDYLPPTESIFGRDGKPQSHWLYVADDVVTYQRRDPREGENGMLVELRSTGVQTVFPVSTHDVTGEAITWTLDGEPARVDGIFLQACVDELADEVERQLGIGKSEHGYAEGNGKPKNTGVKNTPVFDTATLCGGSDTISRARAYIAKMPAAISGQGGHQTTWKVAQVLTRGFNLDNDTALGLMHEYNQRCEPPWTEKELAHKIEDASKSTLPIGYLLDDDHDYGAYDHDHDDGHDHGDGAYGHDHGHGAYGHGDHGDEPTTNGKAKPKPEESIDRQISYRWAEAIEAEDVEWLWHGYIPQTGVTFFDGDPEAGKTCCALDIIARVTTGEPMPGEATLGRRPPQFVSILAKEDRYENTIKPRLHAAGADMRKVACIDHVNAVGKSGVLGKEFITLPKHTPTLLKHLRDINAKLLLIDPYDNHLDDGLKTASSMDMRKAFTPLADGAGDLGCALLIIRHFGKKEYGNAKHKGLGSIGLTGLARSNLASVDDGAGGYVFGRIKGNLSRQPDSLIYQIRSWEEKLEIPKLHWCGTSDVDVRAAAVKYGNEKGETKTETCQKFLRTLLLDGPRDEKECRELVLAAGISERTYRTARKAAGIKSRKTGIHDGWELHLDRDIQQAN